MSGRRLTAFGSVVAVCLFGSALAPAGASAAEPILFVHGYTRSASDWDTMKSRFQADGWPASHLSAYSYNTNQSNVTSAEQEVKVRVDNLLAATGASKVDIVTHSMGGLNTRYYIKNLGGDAKVDDWVSLGGPNHGTDTANFCTAASCYEMRIGSTFLNSLNAVDETPGAVNYRTWWSSCDSVINPDSSVSLTGATNTKTTCISHNNLTQDAGVYGQVRDVVR